MRNENPTTEDSMNTTYLRLIRRNLPWYAHEAHYPRRQRHAAMRAGLAAVRSILNTGA